MKSAIICYDSGTDNIILLAAGEDNELNRLVNAYEELVKFEVKKVSTTGVNMELIRRDQTLLNETFKHHFNC